MDVLGRGISSVVRRCLNRESGHEFAVKIIDLLQEEAPTIEEVQNEVCYRLPIVHIINKRLLD